MIRSFLLTTTAALLAQPALAQTAPQDPVEQADTRPDRHVDPSDTIIVTAPYARNQADVLSGTSIISGAELTRVLRPTIGDTLASQPGVSATSFGPNASRPILRGFQGERVRVLTDGIGSIDASNTSVDHAVVINPLTADRIEVLRGPSALLFGSSAIGGVVNVVDSRIPLRMPEAPFHAEGIASYGSAAGERSVSSKVDVPVTSNIVVHADASYVKTRDLNTGNFILSRPLRAEAAASADPGIRDLAQLRGALPNSAGRTWDVAAGAALINDRGNLGFSVSHYDSIYGVPVRYSFDPAVEAERVRLQLRQTRVDVRGEVETGGGLLDKIRLRLGAADYQHEEIDDTGAVGTTFFNQGYEGRLELVQAKRGNWQGAVGGQFVLRTLNVIGAEKFLPKNDSQQYGVFTLQSFDLGPFKGEAGARYEHSIVQAAADADLGNPALTRSFDAFSGSLGASYAIAGGVRIGLNASHSERGPSAEELFANGPHAGTQAFEIGNPDFVKETSNGLEGTLRASGDGYSFGASVYYNWFNNYIYDVRTGEVRDDLPVFQSAQANARYYGAEIEASARIARIGDTTVNVDGLGDYVHATIVNQGPVPRIPPLRVLGGIEAQSERFNARFEVEHIFKQDRLAAFETPTNGFTLVNASLSVNPFGRDNPTSLTLSANNLFNVEARRHASFLKDFAPLAGRDLRITARVRM